MSHPEQDHSGVDDTEDVRARRQFLKLATGATAVALVAGSGALSRLAWAKGLPPLRVSDPMAKALDYTEDASKSSNPKHVQGDDCSNCVFYQGKAGAARGPCKIFPGKSVNAKGWCVSHQRKS